MRTYKFCFFTCLFILLQSSISFAQSMSVGSVSIGSISSPKMPTIESPTIGDSFYVPGNTNYYQSKEKTTSDTKKDTTVTPQKDLLAESSSTLLNDRTIPYLSAQDISAMSNMGLLSRMNTLFDDNYYLKNTNNYSSKADAADYTEKLLQKVLKELDEIKADISTADKKDVYTTQNVSLNSNVDNSQVKHIGKKKSHMLRFSVNGYNILNTCRTVYISDVQKDGTFLVTGDRRYLSDGKTCNETFHMLFKVASDSTSYSGYTASSAVSQDTYNPNSFMYQLTQHKNLSATRTGNLVSMRTTDDDWKLDLLIDLGATE